MTSVRAFSPSRLPCVPLTRPAPFLRSPSRHPRAGSTSRAPQPVHPTRRQSTPRGHPPPKERPRCRDGRSRGALPYGILVRRALDGRARDCSRPRSRTALGCLVRCENLRTRTRTRGRAFRTSFRSAGIAVATSPAPSIPALRPLSFWQFLFRTRGLCATACASTSSRTWANSDAHENPCSIAFRR